MTSATRDRGREGRGDPIEDIWWMRHYQNTFVSGAPNSLPIQTQIQLHFVESELWSFENLAPTKIKHIYPHNYYCTPLEEYLPNLVDSKTEIHKALPKRNPCLEFCLKRWSNFGDNCAISCKAFPFRRFRVRIRSSAYPRQIWADADAPGVARASCASCGSCFSGFRPTPSGQFCGGVSFYFGCNNRRCRRFWSLRKFPIEDSLAAGRDSGDKIRGEPERCNCRS